MKKLCVLLVLFMAKESLGDEKQLYWNLKNYMPFEEVTKRCNENPRAWLRFWKGPVELACDCLDRDLNIIREAFDVAKDLSSDDIENKKIEFLAQAEHKMLDAQHVKRDISVIFSDEDSAIEQSEKFISTRDGGINRLFHANALLRVFALEMCRDDLNLDALARMRSIGAADDYLIERMQTIKMEDKDIAAKLKALDEKYPELRDVKPRRFYIEMLDELENKRS